MKMIEKANDHSKNPYERFAAFIMDASTVDTMIRRLKAFRKLATVVKYHDNFIFESLDPVISGATLATYVHNLREDYRCDFIYEVSHHGEVIRDNNGMIIGKSSCNVYSLEIHPDELNAVLDDIKELIMKKFDI